MSSIDVGMNTCLVCGSVLNRLQERFCSKACYFQAYRLRLLHNNGWFKKGMPSINRGRTLDSLVGEERARAIRQKMSINSKKKADQLRRLNQNLELLRRRSESRKFHDRTVRDIAVALRGEGKKCFVLSEYVKEKRIPDIIVFDANKLIALEVELEKKWKPSNATIVERLSSLNAASSFFDRTEVIFVTRDDRPGPTYDGPLPSREETPVKLEISSLEEH